MKSLLRRARRRLSWHRRPLAALCAAAATACALLALAPPAPPSATLLVAARDLPAGSVLGSSDTRTVQVPPTTVPAGALEAAAATGRELASPVRRGEPLTDVRVVGAAGLGRAAGPGRVAVPVRLADDATTALLQVGDRVDVVAAGTGPSGEAAQARTVAYSARVLALPDAPSAGAGLLPTDGGRAGLVVLAASPPESLALARAAVSGRLSVVLVGQEGTKIP
ncbi:Flp pilus assembly protein CpaB [Motilibacter sp. E257]|uniref:Flp pilus assembly protein CpaB n=1 Tax=Motilibacter deserti TaxID=2714956 RepID=A0ABX0GY46_9ACTN|nr:Flp pilus assembly protein CpaB [Motilibacter deserti]